jgi:hypothetical protein
MKSKKKVRKSENYSTYVRNNSMDPASPGFKRYNDEPSTPNTPNRAFAQLNGQGYSKEAYGGEQKDLAART